MIGYLGMSILDKCIMILNFVLKLLHYLTFRSYHLCRYSKFSHSIGLSPLEFVGCSLENSSACYLLVASFVQGSSPCASVLRRYSFHPTWRGCSLAFYGRGLSN